MTGVQTCALPISRIQIESIGGKAARVAARPKAHSERVDKPAVATPATTSDLPAGYADMTIADIKSAAAGWDAGTLDAALAFEQEHGKRKGAIAALESARALEEGES